MKSQCGIEVAAVKCGQVASVWPGMGAPGCYFRIRQLGTELDCQHCSEGAKFGKEEVIP